MGTVEHEPDMPDEPGSYSERLREQGVTQPPDPFADEDEGDGQWPQPQPPDEAPAADAPEDHVRSRGFADDAELREPELDPDWSTDPFLSDGSRSGTTEGVWFPPLQPTIREQLAHTVEQASPGVFRAVMFLTGAITVVALLALITGTVTVSVLGVIVVSAAVAAGCYLLPSWAAQNTGDREVPGDLAPLLASALDNIDYLAKYARKVLGRDLYRETLEAARATATQMLDAASTVLTARRLADPDATNLASRQQQVVREGATVIEQMLTEVDSKARQRQIRDLPEIDETTMPGSAALDRLRRGEDDQ